MREVLEYQADQIELVLQTHRTPGQVTGGVVTPRWVRYQILPAIGTRVVSIARLSEEIALRLDAGNVRVSRQGGDIHIEVPRQDPKPVKFRSVCQKIPKMPRQSAILGIDGDGVPLVIRLPSPEVAHVLIAGTTGSGKTALAQTMALSLAAHNRLSEVQLAFIDPKGAGFGPLAELPHLLRPVIREVHQAIFFLGELIEEMVRRDQHGICEPRIMVFIDELADLMDHGGNAMSRLMSRLTQRGRSAGIHMIACTQKPLAASIGSITRSNFPVRLVGSVTSPEDAKIAAGIAGTGAERLLGRGDFVLVMKGNVTRFQAAYLSPQERSTIIAQLRQGNPGRNWLAETATATATGTDNRRGLKRFLPASKGAGNFKSWLGTQLRLIK